MQFTETIWAIIPPVVSIGLALITKEVYISLFIGIFIGALLFTGFQPLASLETIFSIIGKEIGDNANIIVFLTLLGMLVSLLEKSGASSSYGDWAAKKFSTKRGVLAATSVLGALIMVDDYFICLTTGTVMSPVADKKRISRTKLAYIVCSTAAPVCILAPISSWATAVSSSLPESSTIDGFNLFLQTIPFNLFALLTLFMLVFLVIADFDFGAMKKYEDNYLKQTSEVTTDEKKKESRGKISDLVLPLIGLIVFCVSALLYTGGYFSGEGVSITSAFNECDSSLALAIGAFLTLVLTALWYLPRKIVSFMEFANSFSDGFKTMSPAILILVFAWTLSGICNENHLNLGGFVSGLVANNSYMLALMPALFFIVSAGLAFATGTSWGTFTILIPIAVTVFGDLCPLMVITVAAILGGSVCGDITSPISDTTVIVSAGTGCGYMEHVSTQIPYSFLVAGLSLVGYIVAGFTENGWYGLITSAVLLTAVLTVFLIKNKRTKA